jgi:hypothetical protein
MCLSIAQNVDLQGDAFVRIHMDTRKCVKTCSICTHHCDVPYEVSDVVLGQ